MESLSIVYFFVITTFLFNLVTFVRKAREINRRDLLTYLYLLLSVGLWIITNAIADLSKSFDIAFAAAKLAILFPLNFMTSFFILTSIFPPVLTQRKWSGVKVISFGTIILSLTFLLFLNSSANIINFKINESGPAEYTPGIFYTISLAYAIIIMFATIRNWIKSFKNYTLGQRNQVYIMILSLIIVYISLGVGLTYFPEVGLIEYGPVSFLSLSFLLYLINRTFFVKSFSVNIYSDIIKVLTFILLAIVNICIFLLVENQILGDNLLELFIISITSLVTYTIIGSFFIKTTNINIEKAKSEVFDFNNRISPLVSKEEILKELVYSIKTITRSQKISLYKREIEETPEYIRYAYKLWEKSNDFGVLTSEIIIDREIQNSSYQRWKRLFVRLLVKEKINSLIPIIENQRIVGCLTTSGGFAQLNKDDYELLQLLSQNLSIGLSRASLYEKVDELNKDLERKVEKQTNEIKRKYKQLLEAQEKEKEMIDIMGHELRTPISIIKLQFSLLVAKIKQNGNIKIFAKYIENINSAIERESRLINSLLGATKIDKNKLELDYKKENLVEIVQESCAAHSRDLGIKNLSLKIEYTKKDNWIIETDKIRLLEVFDNLISNAIKYTHRGGITIILAKTKDNYIITYKDTGIGISKKDLKKIGTKFYRIKDKKKHLIKPGGTGLGLYVTMGIIKKHKGNLSIESEVGKGSSFRVEIPKKQKSRGRVIVSKKLNIFERIGLRKT